MAVQPPGPPPLEFGTTLHSRALFPPIGPGATPSTSATCLNLAAQGPGIGASAICPQNPVTRGVADLIAALCLGTSPAGHSTCPFPKGG
jgi:hypothetical protein